MIRRTIVIALVVLVLAVAANDIWRYVQAQQRLRDTTYTISRWAAENASSSNRNAIADRLVTMAGSSGVTVTTYDQNDMGVRVWTQTDVPGLIVAGAVANLLRGRPPSAAAAIIVKDYREAGIK